MNKKYRLGLRAIKTSIAVLICILLSIILKRSDMFFSSIATVICMRQTYPETYDAGVGRLIGTLLGGFVGLTALSICRIIPNSFYFKHYISSLLAPIFILAVVYICNTINCKASVQIACIVLLSVILSHSNSAYSNTLFYVINRVFDTSMGIFVAMFVNKFLFRKKSQIKLKWLFILLN